MEDVYVIEGQNKIFTLDLFYRNYVFVLRMCYCEMYNYK